MEISLKTLAILERRRVITTDKKESIACCGLRRDDDGFCVHRPGHPVYVKIEPEEDSIQTIVGQTLNSVLSMQQEFMGKRFVYVSDIEELKQRRTHA